MKYGFICPHCHQSIEYDEEYYDRKINDIGQRIRNINYELQDYNKMSVVKRKEYDARRKCLIVEQRKLQSQIRELKAYRKSANKLRDQFVFVAFKEIIKEKYGVDVFQKLFKEAEESVAMCSTEELMTRGYSRKKGINIHKIV